jgi:hypothetical protein
MYYKAEQKNNYICSGIHKRPPRYKKDNIKLCLSSTVTKEDFYMTAEEASYIISVLGASVGRLMPGIRQEDVHA